MLVKLLPEQISKFWDLIRFALENHPPLTVDFNHESWVNEILTSAMTGQIEVWASYRKDEKLTFEGVVITEFAVDKFIRKKSLIIDYVYAYGKTVERTWVDGLKVLASYAKSRGCTRILAYSNVPEIINISKRLGGDVSISLISFNIGGK